MGFLLPLSLKVEVGLCVVRVAGFFIFYILYTMLALSVKNDSLVTKAFRVGSAA